MKVLAIFGPTAVGKTGVAIAVARRLQERGEDPVAVNCDSIQVYRGLEVLSGTANAEEQAQLEHRLVSFVGVGEEFSAGRFAELARAEIDSLLAAGRLPILVGGTGLYLQAALSELELRPPAPAPLRAAVERELAERGPAALHAELDPDLASTVHPNDRKRIARWTELQRAGIEPPASSEGLWSERLRHPTTLIGLVVEPGELASRIERRVEAMVAAGAAAEARAAVGASRTARAALGFEQFLAGDEEGVMRAHRAYARRQLTWMRRMSGIELIDRTDRTDDEVAAEIASIVSWDDD